MKCANCGYIHGLGAQFCGNCGTRIFEQGTASPVLSSAPVPAQIPQQIPAPVTTAEQPAERVVPQGFITVPTGFEAPAAEVLPAPVHVTAAESKVAPRSVTDDDPEATRVAPIRRAATSWAIVLPTGERHNLTESVVIGRDPGVSAWPAATGILVVTDPEGSVSKSHAVLEVDGPNLWVRDLGSTNGVFVIAPTGIETRVEAGQRVDAPEGSDIELGNFVVRVERGT